MPPWWRNWKISPRATRAGWLRYNDPLFLESEAATWTLLELQRDQVAPEQRRALADALVRNLRNAPQVALEAAWMQQIGQEQDAVVRQVLIEGLRHASSDSALSVLKRCSNTPTRPAVLLLPAPSAGGPMGWL